MKSEYKAAKLRRIAAERDENESSEKVFNVKDNIDSDSNKTQPKFYEIKEGEEFIGSNNNQFNPTNNTRYTPYYEYLIFV